MKSLVCCSLFIVLWCVQSYAQDTVMHDIQQRVYSLPYYSYGKGLGFTSPDSIYQMNIRFRIQSRASLNDGDHQPPTIDGQVRRLRLRLDGYVGNPRYTYALQLSFAPGDLGGTVNHGHNLQIIRDAVVFYSINERASIGFGQTKLPGNRQRVNSSGGLQLTDRSINNAMFNIDRDFGVHFNYLVQNRDRISYNLKAAISQGEGRNFTDNRDTHLAYTGKVEIYPLGSFMKNGEYFEGDIMREPKPKLMLSAAYQFNNKAKKAQGQLGETLYEARNQHVLLTDMAFKYYGIGLMMSYMKRMTDDVFTFSKEDPSRVAFVRAGQGFDAQGSYLLPNFYEVIGRYSWQKMHKEISPIIPQSQQLTLGLTKYIWEHAFKLQGEASYTLVQPIDLPVSNQWYFRFQIEIGI